MKTNPDDLAQRILDLCESEGFALSSLDLLSGAGKHSYETVLSDSLDSSVPKAHLAPKR